MAASTAGDVATVLSLMLLATIILSDAGIARVTLLHTFLPPWLTPTVFVLIPLIVWDLATLGKVHRTTVFGGLLVLMIRLAPGGMAGLFKQLVWRSAKS